MSARTISDLERGLTRRSHPDTLQLLAEALRLSEDNRALLLLVRTTPPEHFRRDLNALIAGHVAAAQHPTPAEEVSFP